MDIDDDDDEFWTDDIERIFSACDSPIHETEEHPFCAVSFQTHKEQYVIRKLSFYNKCTNKFSKRKQKAMIMIVLKNRFNHNRKKIYKNDKMKRKKIKIFNKKRKN